MDAIAIDETIDPFWAAKTLPEGMPVREAMETEMAVYFGATGGAGALLGLRIKDAKVIAYDDLGPEAVRELTVENFPVLVINDCVGGDLYAVPDLEAALG